MAKHYKKKSYKANDKGVVAKKHLGQHFLKDLSVAERIASTLSYQGYEDVLEIGPGTGVLTQFILRPGVRLTALDVDQESIAYLQEEFPLTYHDQVSKSHLEVINADFLKLDLAEHFAQKPIGIIGNFPYNISTQIVFKAIENRHQVLEFGGMFQKEVAQRICALHGSKTYGILSVLTQAYYETQYVFTIGPEVFNPPPKVDSGVLMLQRRADHDEHPFTYLQLRRVVKLAFQQRRKTLRNSLSTLQLTPEIKAEDTFNLRPEQMSVADFMQLTHRLVVLGLV